MKTLRLVGAFLFDSSVIVAIWFAVVYVASWIVAGDSHKPNYSANEGWSIIFVVVGSFVIATILLLALTIRHVSRACSGKLKDRPVDWYGFPTLVAVLVAFWFSPLRPIAFPSPGSSTPSSYQSATVSPRIAVSEPKAREEIPNLLQGLFYPESTVSSMSIRTDPKLKVVWPSITIVPPTSVPSEGLIGWCENRVPGGEKKPESYRVETVRSGDNLPMVLYVFRAKAGPEAGQMVIMYMTHRTAN